MKPYVYKITSKNNEFYYGVRWCYNTNPEDDLWKNYFTSSALIHEMIKKYGLDYFEPIILKLFDDKKDALNYEYELIKNSIDDIFCLNKSLGKCTIWDEKLKKSVSNSVKKLWDSHEYRVNQSIKHKGELNQNFNLPSWRNHHSDIISWSKVPLIYDDFINEKWDLSKYGFGRTFLMKRYGIKQGTARCLINKLKKGWNPKEDTDFTLFLNEINARVL